MEKQYLEMIIPTTKACIRKNFGRVNLDEMRCFFLERFVDAMRGDDETLKYFCSKEYEQRVTQELEIPQSVYLRMKRFLLKRKKNRAVPKNDSE